MLSSKKILFSGEIAKFMVKVHLLGQILWDYLHHELDFISVTTEFSEDF